VSARDAHGRSGTGGTGVEVTKIVVADDHFLYLPLFYAHHKNYFGLLPSGTQIKIERSTNYTDRSAFEMLMDEHHPDHREIDMAVCDPATILFLGQPNTHPVVLAALLTNSAFWVVNHKANKGPHLEDLASFSEIIAFKKGTTSFGIASRIFHDPAKRGAILTVNPNEELNLLVDSGPNTIALSPDILRIHKLLETRGNTFGIEMALADTTEYHGMLVTALLTRRDVLEKKPELVKALLQALQMALDAVRDSTDEVVRYACDRFGEKRHTVQSALKEAERATVYPAEIKVSQPNWMKLAETAFRSVEHQFDDAARDKALTFYRIAVEAYENWASQAVKAVKAVKRATEPTASSALSSWQRMAPWAAALLPCVLVIAAFVAYMRLATVQLPWYTPAIMAAAVALAVMCARHGRVEPWTLAGAAFWLPMFGTFLMILALGDLDGAKAFFKDHLKLDADSALSKFSLLIAMIGIWVAEIKYIDKRHKERRDVA
jgi:hypothetical protein